MTEEQEVITVVRHDPEPCRVKFDIEVAPSKVDQMFKQALDKVRQQAKIPGFRPGKAPDNLLLRRYNDDVTNKVKEDLITEAMRHALGKEGLTPATGPQIENEDSLQVERGQSFVFSASLDVYPDFDMPQYSGLQVETERPDVSDEEVEETINNWLQQRADYGQVERPAQTGDLLKVSYSGTLTDTEEEEELPDSAKQILEGEETWLALHEPEILPGCIRELQGSRPGESRTLTVEFPDSYYESTLAGRTAEVSLTVHEIHAAQVPQLTDELAKEAGAEHAEELRNYVRLRLQSQKEQEYEQYIRAELAAKLEEGGQGFDLPPNILAQETYEVLTEMLQQEQQQGADQEQLQQKRDELYEQAQQRAAQQLRRSYILGRVAEQENIDVSEEEVDKGIEMVSQQQNMAPKELKRVLRENGRIMDLYYRIRDSKAMDRVVELADRGESEKETGVEESGQETEQTPEGEKSEKSQE